MRLKVSKCVFLREQVQYLGHTISKQGIGPDPDKVVLTDNAACVSLLNKVNPSAKLARWSLIIQEMDLEIRYRPGKSNASVDTLSRIPTASVASEFAASEDLEVHKELILTLS